MDDVALAVSMGRRGAPGSIRQGRKPLYCGSSWRKPIPHEFSSGPTNVFVSKVAPTTELGGRVSTPGGATQVLVPNRGAWSAPVHVGTIGN